MKRTPRVRQTNKKPRAYVPHRDDKPCRDKRGCQLISGHLGDHVAVTPELIVYAWKARGTANDWEACKVPQSMHPTEKGAKPIAKAERIICLRPEEHDGSHCGISRNGRLMEWAGDGAKGSLSSHLSKVDLAARLLGTREDDDFESLADLCGKCGRELGEHDGKKCPAKAKSIEVSEPPSVLAKFKDDLVTAIGRTLAPGATILGYARHPAAALYPMLDTAELEQLAADIKANGLRDAIILIRDSGGKDSILDGSNRGRACELAGVKPRFEYYNGPRDMPALVDFAVSKNEHRRHLAPSVRAMIADNAARLKQGNRGSQTGTGAGLTQAQAAKQHNVSERLVRQARVVNDRGEPKVREAVMQGKLELKAAEQLTKLPAAKQTEIAERALAKKSGEVKSGHVRALVKQEEKRAVVAKINTGCVAPLVGTYRLIAIDPAWQYENSDGHDGSRGHTGYPTMSIDEVCALASEIDKVAHDDCILACWFTNAFVHEIGRVLAAWKFEHRTMLTWGKDRMGLGSWLRGKTEHLVIASRGKPIHTLNEITTLMMAPVREHSRKPDEIMNALAKHCPGPHLEMFAREQRDGWTVWGAETQKFEAA